MLKLIWDQGRDCYVVPSILLAAQSPASATGGHASWLMAIRIVAHSREKSWIFYSTMNRRKAHVGRCNNFKTQPLESMKGGRSAEHAHPRAPRERSVAWPPLLPACSGLHRQFHHLHPVYLQYVFEDPLGKALIASSTDATSRLRTVPP